MGIKDHFVAAVKGYLLSNIKDASIIDITHQVSAFNISEAAYVLRNCYNDFPEKTIHLINVDSDNSSNDTFIAVKFNKQYFLGSNNGIISLVTDQKADEICVIEYKSRHDAVFPLKNILAPAAVKIAQKYNLNAVGAKTDKMAMISSLNPILEKDVIRGMVIYIDNYGNAITNISKKVMERYDYSNIRIEFSSNEVIENISELYTDVYPGDALCLFSSGDLLEIAINKSNAAKLFGLQLKSKVLITFS